jgi:UDP-N-acetyl-2-amino-2-deoxyglucuronate dehydrogenase
MLKFGMTGVAGYVAPRHLQAIANLGHELVAALDPSDSVGILDRFFPECRFFTEFERFDRHLEKLRRLKPQGGIDYLSVCSPNYLHDAHIRAAMRVGAHAICEKPLVLSPWNLDALAELEAEYQRRVYTVFQLRLHPSVLELKRRIDAQPDDRIHEIDLSYITSRGQWYMTSWKADSEKSGGLASNIGVHFFDMLLWLFGPLQYSEVHLRDPRYMAGYLELKKARVRWFLSIDSADLPEAEAGKMRTWRSMTVDGEEVEFSGGFEDLHQQLYRQTLAGEGIDIEAVRPTVDLIYDIRSTHLKPNSAYMHPQTLKRLKN